MSEICDRYFTLNIIVILISHLVIFWDLIFDLKKCEVIINYKVDQAANPKQLSKHLVNQAITENHVN